MLSIPMGHAKYTRRCTCWPGGWSGEQIHEHGTIASRACRRACLPSLTLDVTVIQAKREALVYGCNAWT